MDTVTQNYSDFVSTSKRTKEVPVGKVMRLESEGRLDLIWNLSPGSEVVDRVAVAELLYPVAGLDKLKLNVNFKSNVFKLLVILINPPRP